MIWYPYTQMKGMKSPYKITGAEGVCLYTNGRKLIDSVSSWWSAIHGYNHPEMNEAIISQVRRFSHIMLGGLTHDPAERLAEKLGTILPGGLNHCFFSDSGSVAVEVALKMALQYFVNRGETQRTMTLSLEHSYHGDTFRAMEAGDDEDYHFILKACGKNTSIIHIPTNIADLDGAFRDYGGRLNCMIVEPLLQCAGGMRIYGLDFLRRARELCDKYGVLLVFDEVATGFGRTGNRFAADLVQPDILILGKALTGGYIGHAVTVANGRVFAGFYDDDQNHAFMHGPTFMGNALACTAALKSIEIFERDNYLARVKRIEEISRDYLGDFTARGVREVRIIGGCVCIECGNPEVTRGFQDFAYDRGVFSRPFLKYIYTMPPYVISEGDLVSILRVMKGWFQR
ncbi:MAG: adenosylmethionine--8-amino-7-oxononanoate transaminase [Synergistaceae bacterium]|nr:adenosylmethionine--8-amino-7-oxononanoate transaminase [Synergistaceae bacterium]